MATSTETPDRDRGNARRDGSWTAAIAVWVVGYVALAIFMAIIA